MQIDKNFQCWFQIKIALDHCVLGVPSCGTSICSHLFLHTVSIFPFSIKKHIIFFSSALNTVDRRICIRSFRSWSTCSSHSLLFEGVTNSQVQNIRHVSTIVQNVLTDSKSFIHVCCSVVRTIKNNHQTEFVQEITQFFAM